MLKKKNRKQYIKVKEANNIKYFKKKKKIRLTKKNITINGLLIRIKLSKYNVI